MKRLIILLSIVPATGLLVGCGDPAPSTPVAPEVKMPDTSKMSPEEVMKLKGKGEPSSDRPGATAAPSASPGDRGATPPDRRMPGG